MATNLAQAGHFQYTQASRIRLTGCMAPGSLSSCQGGHTNSPGGKSVLARVKTIAKSTARMMSPPTLAANWPPSPTRPSLSVARFRPGDLVLAASTTQTRPGRAPPNPGLRRGSNVPVAEARSREARVVVAQRVSG